LDALNSEGEEFGEERIIHCLTSLPGSLDAEGICKRLAAQVAEWAAGADRFDDSTIIALSCQTLKHNVGPLKQNVEKDKLHLGAGTRRACNR
jgi:hypothetical protein